MGYTHYWFNRRDLPPLSAECVSKLSKAFDKYSMVIQCDYNDDRPPVVTSEEIFFNGIEDEGHEAFQWEAAKTGFAFCKTARKKYDLVVCLVVLLLKREYGLSIHFETDGEMLDWADAFEEFEVLYGTTANPAGSDRGSWLFPARLVVNLNPTTANPAGMSLYAEVRNSPLSALPSDSSHSLPSPASGIKHGFSGTSSGHVVHRQRIRRPYMRNSCASLRGSFVSRPGSVQSTMSSVKPVM